MPRYYYPNPRSITERANRIELSWLLKHNFINGYRGGNLQWSVNKNPTGNINILVNTTSDTGYIQLTYKTRFRGEEEWRSINYFVSMESKPCKYGGKKWFFVCGFNGCKNRARILYQGDDHFVCRKCANLSYESCNKSNRIRSGYFGMLSKHWNAQDYLKKLKKIRYKGRFTKKYLRYLRMDSFSDYQLENAGKQIELLLTAMKK